MAIDTENKRRSAVQNALPFLAVLPVADGSLNQADRQHVSWLYRGILAAGGAAAARSRMLLLGVRQFALFIGGFGR